MNCQLDCNYSDNSVVQSNRVFIFVHVSLGEDIRQLSLTLGSQPSIGGDFRTIVWIYE